MQSTTDRSSLSQARLRPLSPKLEACVRADVRIPPAASQLCLRYRDDPALSYGLLHPPCECVSASVYVCGGGGGGVIAGRPQPGVEFKLTCLRATFSCKNAPVLLACDSKERPIPPYLRRCRFTVVLMRFRFQVAPQKEVTD